MMISEILGATACSTWAKIPSRVAMRCGLEDHRLLDHVGGILGVMVGTDS
jgi:hypothetical protein